MAKEITPAPWELGKINSSSVFALADGETICEICPTENWKANADLISAAPAMYEALKKVVQQIEELPVHDRLVYDFFYTPAKAALNKANPQ